MRPMSGFAGLGARPSRNEQLGDGSRRDSYCDLAATEVSIENALKRFIERLEQDRSLGELQQLRQRIDALDELEAFLCDGRTIGTALHRRATALYAQLESVNTKLYEAIRHDIPKGACRRRLFEWMSDSNGAANLTNCNGYDYLDELVSGVLQFEEPSAEIALLGFEMVSYQPTPARHIYDFLDRTTLTQRDVLIDLGSGLGHVILMAGICTRAKCVGIEFEPSYVECARKSARLLNLHNVRFIQADARTVDLSEGTVFYLYTPFTGGVLRGVLNSLRQAAFRRKIRICTFGPCTQVVAQEQWVTVMDAREAGRVAVFRSSA
jgi:hypothetical protein